MADESIKSIRRYNKMRDSAERENKRRETRIFDNIPGRNTAPRDEDRDFRKADDVEYRSHEKLLAEERADKAFKERQKRLVWGMLNDATVQKVIAEGIKAPREIITQPKGSAGLAQYLRNKEIERAKNIKRHQE